jgi:metallophosphoesterase superfamily enzyme
MSDPQPERIGDLVFVQNPDYPYPFNVPAPPYFWMEEQSGVLAPAINKYMNGESLNQQDLNLLRQYLRQYLERAVLTGDAKRQLLLDRVAKLRSGRDIERFAEELAEYGVEPF